MAFYSARLLYVIIVGDGKPRRRVNSDETVVVFRARDPFDASARALALGRAREAAWRNAWGQRVRYALAEVQTIDRIGTRIDGAEVMSTMQHRTFDRPLSAQSRLHPERSKTGNAFPAGELTKQPKATKAPRRAARSAARGSPDRR